MKILLKEFRIRRGWTQKELAERSCLPQPVISDIETTKTADPNLSTMCKLARALRCMIEDLIEEDGT